MNVSVIDIVTLTLSVTALVVSTWPGIRQSWISKRAHHLPVVIELLKELRSIEFQDQYQYVCTKLRGEHDPTLGISGLPNPVRRIVYNVGYYHTLFATLVILDVIDETDTIALLRDRIINVWKSIAPYVLREREINSATGHFYMTHLEWLAGRAEKVSQEKVQRILEEGHRRPWYRRF